MDHREGTCGGQPQDLTGSRSPAQRRVRGASPPRHEGWVCNCRQEWSPGCPGSPGYLGIAEQLGGRKPSSTACIPSRSEADSQLHWPAQARIDVLNTMNPAEYRQWRQRRHATWIEVNRKRIHPDNDAELLIDFARRWAPYGGPAREEILVNFGMTTRRFVERLWQVIPESNCNRDEISNLTCVYPQPPASERLLTHSVSHSPLADGRATDDPTHPKNFHNDSESTT